MVRTPVILACVLAAALRAGEPGQPEERLIGPLDEGKVYRTVDGHPLTGKLIADFEVAKRWKEELAAFRDQLLVRAEAERKKAVVTDQEVEDEIRRQVVDLAKRMPHLQPERLNLDEMAKVLQTPLDYLRESIRTVLLLKKVMVAEKLLKEDDAINLPQYQQKMRDHLDLLARQAGVIEDERNLGDGEAIRIAGAGHSKEEIRTFIMKRLGLLPESEVRVALDTLTLEYLVGNELAKLNEKRLNEEAARELGFADLDAFEKAATEEQKKRFEEILAKKRSERKDDLRLPGEMDRKLHYRYYAGVLALEQGIPIANGRDLLRMQIERMGWTENDFLHQRPTTIDAAITALAISLVTRAMIDAEYAANPDAYKRTEPRIAHIFIQVRDPQGQPYGPNWRVPGNQKINDFVSKVRDEQFEKARPKIDALISAAHANFAEAARRSSDCEKSKVQGGLVGRLGPDTSDPAAHIEPGLFEYAKKLKPDEISEPVRSEYGWHLLKCLRLQETTQDEAEQHVYLILLKKKRKEISDALIGNAKIEDKY